MLYIAAGPWWDVGQPAALQKLEILILIQCHLNAVQMCECAVFLVA